MTSIQPELWVDRAAEAVAFYQAAFGAIVLHRVGEGEDIVAQLVIGNAAFWVARAGSAGRLAAILTETATGNWQREYGQPPSMRPDRPARRPGTRRDRHNYLLPHDEMTVMLGDSGTCARKVPLPVNLIIR